MLLEETFLIFISNYLYIQRQLTYHSNLNLGYFMKARMLVVLLLAVMVSLSLGLANGDKKSSCCEKGTKASMTKDGKECTMKEAKMSDNCTDADKAHCDMAKATKASMKKVGTKTMDCCKDKTKASEAKNSKSTQEKTAEGKGTN
jgi:hypothetical protein